MGTWMGLGLSLAGGGVASAAPAPVPVYDFDVNHVTSAANLVSAMSNQGSLGGSMVQTTGANQPSLATVAGYVTGDGSNDYLSYELLQAQTLISRNILPDSRGGGNDTGNRTNPASYNAGTTYASGDFVDYLGTPYRSKVGSNLGNQPDVSPTQWAPGDYRAFSATHINRNLKKGSGYVVANDGRRWQSDGTSNLPSLVFLNDDFTKDTAYGDGTGFYDGELILSAYNGSSPQGVAFNPDDTDYVWVMVVGTGIVELPIAGGSARTTISSGMTAMNGMAVLGNSNPLGDGTYFITCNGTDQIFYRYNKAGTLLGSSPATGAVYDSLWWWPERGVLLCTTSTSIDIFSAYGVKLGDLPRNTTAPTAYNDASYGADAIDRIEGAIVSADESKVVITHNGSYHGMAGPATPPVSSVSDYTLAGKSGVVGDAPVLEVFLRGMVASAVASKALFNFGDPNGNTGGVALWINATADPYLRVYANVKGGVSNNQNATFSIGAAPTTDKVYHVIWDGPNGTVEVRVDGVSLGVDSTTFTHMQAVDRVGYALLAIMHAPYNTSARNPTLRFKGLKAYAGGVGNVASTGLTEAQRTTILAAMQAIA